MSETINALDSARQDCADEIANTIPLVNYPGLPSAQEAVIGGG